MLVRIVERKSQNIALLSVSCKYHNRFPSIVISETQSEQSLATDLVQYLHQLRKTAERLRGMNTAQADDLVANLAS
jgi:hypothetical protein